MSVFNLPDLGEGLHDAEIVQWNVAPGDRVEAGQTLLSVETDSTHDKQPTSIAVTRLGRTREAIKHNCSHEQR